MGMVMDVQSSSGIHYNGNGNGSYSNWDSGFINGQHPDMEDDDIGPAAIVIGSAIVTLGAVTVVATITAVCVSILRRACRVLAR